MASAASINAIVRMVLSLVLSRCLRGPLRALESRQHPGEAGVVADCRDELGVTHVERRVPGVEATDDDAGGGTDAQVTVFDNFSRGVPEWLELDAVLIGEDVLKIPDLIGLEQKLADAGCKALITDVASVKGNLLRLNGNGSLAATGRQGEGTGAGRSTLPA